MPAIGERVLSLVAGARLGPYEILTPIGAGGMGEVYKAFDTRLDRMVAIKVLPSDVSDNPAIKARFMREAKAISQLTHPHICTLYDIGSENGVDYLVMELLEGQTLLDRLQKGAIPPPQVVVLGVEIADALDKAHRSGIVHRDLKPGNIMLTKSGVKLLDFGLAKILPPKPSFGGIGRDQEVGGSLTPTEVLPPQPLTRIGIVMGTPQYMAPEQVEAKDVDNRTDIFSFGCVLYEMATGRKAFQGASRTALIVAILKENPTPVVEFSPMSAAAFDRLVRMCLAKDPEDRWQSARDVRNELLWIAEAGSQSRHGVPVATNRKNWTRAWLAGAAVIGAFAMGALLLQNRGRVVPKENLAAPRPVITAPTAPPKGGANGPGPVTAKATPIPTTTIKPAAPQTATTSSVSAREERSESRRSEPLTVSTRVSGLAPPTVFPPRTAKLLPQVEQSFPVELPESVRAQHPGEHVGLSVTVSEDGSVKRATVISEVCPECDRAALDAIKHFKFKPARDGENHFVEATIAISLPL